MATNPNEAIFDAETRHAIYLERFGRGIARRMVKLLLEAEKDITGKLRELPDGPTKTQQAALLRTVRARITDLTTDFRDQMTAELLKAADYEAEFTDKLFADGYEGLGASFQAVPLENVRAAVMSRPFQGIHLRWANPPEHASELVRRNFRAMQGEIERGFIEGESISAINARIRPLIEVKAARDVETISITAVKHIGTVARQEFHKVNPGLIDSERWNAVLDGRTSSVCFPAETLVTPAGGVLKAFRRWFEGEIVTITTAAGHQVSATPNHPILTTRGWLAIHEIKPADKVVNAVPLKLIGLEVGQDVSVPAPIGAIFDALNEPSVSEVFVRRSSKADFHGDGMGGDHEIDVSAFKGDLRNGIKASSNQSVKDVLLCGINLGAFLPSESNISLLLSGGGFPCLSSKFSAPSVEGGVEPGLGPIAGNCGKDIDGSGPLAVHLNGQSGVIPDELVGHPSGQAGQNADFLEEGGDSSDGCPVFPSNSGGGFSVRIVTDDVITVSRKHAACHVYNLETTLGYYIAGGLIVKNCRSRDGKVYEVGKGPQPPAHPRCRSTRVGIDPDYPPPTKRTYDQWLRAQSEGVQDEILGKGKADLFRGGLTLDRFFDERRGREYTVAELREMDSRR